MATLEGNVIQEHQRCAVCGAWMNSTTHTRSEKVCAELAALREQNAELIEALIKAESALTYANWDGEFDDKHTANDVINARETARAILAKVKGGDNA